MRAPFKIGDVVRSEYRARWTGRVLIVEPRNAIGRIEGYIVTVLVTTDRHGNPMRKAVTKQLDAAWLKRV
jgi:hypothetical protein